MHCTQNQRHRVLPKPFLLSWGTPPAWAEQPLTRMRRCHGRGTRKCGRQVEGWPGLRCRGGFATKMKITDENLVYLIHLNFLRPHLWACTLCIRRTYNKQENTRSGTWNNLYGSQTNSGKWGWRKRPTGYHLVFNASKIYTLSPPRINGCYEHNFVPTCTRGEK